MLIDKTLLRLTAVLIHAGLASLIGAAVMFFTNKDLKSNPEKLKQAIINEKDERNKRLREKAANSTFWVTLYTLGVLWVVFALLGYTVAQWLIHGAILVHGISWIISFAVYSKKM
jgi:predicted tellurium resistance membrane protein TerC